MKSIIPADIQNIIKALALVVFPPQPELQLDGLYENIPVGLERLLKEFPLFFRHGFLWGIRFFNWLPLFFGLGRLTFLQLPSAQKEKYVDRWANSKVVPIRELFKSIKSLILMVAFSDQRIWPHLGYYPEPHLKEKIALRPVVLEKYGIPATYAESLQTVSSVTSKETV